MDPQERDYSINALPIAIPARPCASQKGEEFGEDGDRTSMDAESEQEEKKTVARKKLPRQQQQGEAGTDTFQREIGKWEEFYDDMKAYLADGSLPTKGQANILKQAEAFSLGPDSSLYYTKLLRDGTMQLKLPVVRNYEDRVRVCKAIHLNTGEVFIHHRRDTMLELLGQQYYWKGQRRDVCQCIASCEVCAVGLGGKRRAKPPSQRRDVRPSPQKLLRLATSPFSVSSSSATSGPLTVPAIMPPSFLSQAGGEGSTRNLSLSSDTTTHTLTDSTCTSSTVVTHLPPDQNLTHKTLSVNLLPDDSATDSTVPVVEDDSNLFTVTDERTLTCSTSLSSSSSPSISAIASKSHSETRGSHVSIASDPVTVSENSGFQIFTTINEPYEHEEGEGNAGTLSKHPLSLSSSVHNYPEVASGGSGAEEYIVQNDSASADATVEVASSAPSIYQLLFQLHSEPNTSLCTAVVESMHMSLQSTADPVQLAQAASKSLVTIFGLSDSTAALVCPSRAAAYVTALVATLLKQDPLSVNPQISRKTASPPTVLHDTCCQAGSPKLCSSLVGASNWNLGTHTTPMDRDMLQMAVASNRVLAVFHRPYTYPRKSSFLQLHTLSSVCHTRESDSNVAVIVDCSNMPATGNSLAVAKFTPTLREMLTRGADFIMLPDTEHFQGPSNTCVLVGGAALLGNMCQQLPLLQSQLGLPLLSSAYDTVGSVVAFKSLQVSTFRTGT